MATVRVRELFFKNLFQPVESIILVTLTNRLKVQISLDEMVV